MTECRCSSLPDPLLSQSELADDRAVTLDISLLQVVQKVSSVTDHLLKTAAAVEVLLVGLQVLGQVSDAVGKDRDLNLGRARVSLVGCVLLDNGELFFFLHGFFTFLFIWRFTQQAVGEELHKAAVCPPTGLTSFKTYYITLFPVCKEFF